MNTTGVGNFQKTTSIMKLLDEGSFDDQERIVEGIPLIHQQPALRFSHSSSSSGTHRPNSLALQGKKKMILQLSHGIIRDQHEIEEAAMSQRAAAQYNSQLTSDGQEASFDYQTGMDEAR